MFDVIKENLKMAIRLKDKVLYDIAKNQITDEVLAQFSSFEQDEIIILFRAWHSLGKPECTQPAVIEAS